MIKITKIKKIWRSGLGTYLYCHFIQYPHSTHKYDCEMSDEGMMYLIEALKKAGNEVEYKEEA